MTDLPICVYIYGSPKEALLEDLNSIISLGKLPDVFENEELDSLLLKIRSVAEQTSYMDSKEALFSFFQKVPFLCVGFITLSCQVRRRRCSQFCARDFQLGQRSFGSYDDDRHPHTQTH